MSPLLASAWLRGCVCRLPGWLWLARLFASLAMTCGCWPGVTLAETESSVATGCYYDGVSQSPLPFLIKQVSERYQLAVVTHEPNSQQALIAQPLGDCSLDAFLQLVVSNSDWGYRRDSYGLILFRATQQPQPAAAAVISPVTTVPKPRLPEEIWVTTAVIDGAAELNARYEQNHVYGGMALPAGQADSANLAEKLQQLGGVTITQEAGEGRQVAIRGLNSSLIGVSINDMPVLATSASIDARGSINNSRSVDFNVLPTELFSWIEVNKSGQARGNDAALGGSVNLKTPMPLDDPEAENRSGWLQTGTSWNDQVDAAGQQLAAGWRVRDDDQRWGLLVSGSYRDTPRQEKGFSTVRWRQSRWGSVSDTASLSASEEEALHNGDIFHPRYNRYDQLDRQLQTLGLNMALQFQSPELGKLSLVYLNTLHSMTMDEYHISSTGLVEEDLSSVQINDGRIQGQDLLYADLSGVDIRTEHNHEENSTRLQQWLLKAEPVLGGDWSMNLALGVQRSRFDSPVHDKVYLWSADQDFSYDLRGHDRIAVNHWGFDITDESAWQVNKIVRYQDRVDNDYYTATLDTGWQVRPDLILRLGGEVERFRNHRNSRSFKVDLSGQGIAATGLSQLTPGNFGRGLGVSGLPRHWRVADGKALAELGYSDVDFVSDDDSGLKELSLAFYSQLDFEAEWLGRPLRGSAGIRFLNTRQGSDGIWQTSVDDDSGSSTDERQVTLQHRYNVWLPALNLAWSATEEWLLRGGYSRGFARPEIDQLTSSLTLQSSSANLITSGNPWLQPMYANAFDLGAEWYGNEGQLLALGLYYKRISSFIVDSVSEVSLDDLPYNNPAWSNLGLDAFSTYEYRRPVNGDGAELLGLELGWRWPLLDWPAPWNHLTVAGNYNHNHSQMRYPDENGDTLSKSLIGLSRNTANISIRWQQLHWSAETSANYRSRYLLTVPGGNGNDEEGVNAALYINARVDWHWSSPLSSSFEVRNLGNQAFDLYTDSANRVYNYAVTGRDYSLRLTWEF